MTEPKRIALGNSDLEISRIGLGCMGMSEFYGSADEAASTKTLHRALELGVNFFDTADMYGPFKNEQLLGKAFANRWQELVIATKFGIMRGEDNSWRGINNHPDYIRECCENSLKRLGIDTIDLYYMHRRDREVPLAESVGAMKRLVEEGKVRHIGLSEVTSDELREAHAIHPIAALQTEYSLWSREPEADLFETCYALGVTFVAYSPLGRGFLTGKIPSADVLDENDWRRQNPRFAAEALAQNKGFVALLEEVAASKGITPAQAALAWVLHQNDRLVTIPGTTKVHRLEENVGALEVSFTEEELATIRENLPKSTAGERY